MNSNLVLFLRTVKELFHVELDQQTSACLYGSAAIGDWVAGRSDLDLFVYIPEEKIVSFGEKLKIWRSKPGYPILDGFVLYRSGNVPLVREFHKFEKAVPLTERFIPLIDSWNVRNQSVHLFGQDVKSFVRTISLEELKDWAFRDIEVFWIPNLRDGLLRGEASPDAKIPLSKFVWTASGVARMVRLAKGDICNSKRESLHWLANEYVEISEMIKTLIDEFEKPDDIATKFTVMDAETLGKFYLRVLCELKR